MTQMLLVNAIVTVQDTVIAAMILKYCAQQAVTEDVAVVMTGQSPANVMKSARSIRTAVPIEKKFVVVTEKYKFETIILL